MTTVSQGSARSAAKDLRTFLGQLEQAHPDEIIRVARRVSADYETCAVVKALEPFGAPAVLFESVTGSDMPLLMGLFGTRERLADALGLPVEECVEAVATVSERLISPRHVSQGPVQETQATGEHVDLGLLPIGVHSRDDAGRYITSGVTVVREPGTGKINTGIYRIMITGRNTLTINAARDHDLGRIIAKAAATGASVDIAIVIGHHPAFAISSQLKHNTTVDSYGVASALLREPLDLVLGVTIDLPVPADAEIVLEGRIDTTDWQQEGPFGEFTYYSGSAQAPVCTITAISHRQDAIYHDLHPTHNEHRCLWLFPGREARLLKAVRASVGGVTAVHIPSRGASLSGYISLDKRHEADGRTAILAAFACDHFLKYVVVVDSDIDITDESDVHWAVNVRFQAPKDLLLVENSRGIRMDPSAIQVPGAVPTQVLTGKMGLDATRPIGATSFPDRADTQPHGFEDVALSEYLEANTHARLLTTQVASQRRSP